MRHFLASVIMACAFTCFAQEPSPDQDCQGFSRNNDYQAAVECLNHQLYLTPPTDTAGLVRLYSLLGVNYMMLEKKKLARASFERLVGLRPDCDLDPNAYLPEIISLFQSVKLARKNDPAPPAMAQSAPLPWAINLLPLGIPQFVKQRRVNGTILAAVQALSLGVSVYAYNRKGSLNTGTFGYPEKDVASAKRYDSTYKITFLIFSGAYLCGVFDGTFSKSEKK